VTPAPAHSRSRANGGQQSNSPPRCYGSVPIKEELSEALCAFHSTTYERSPETQLKGNGVYSSPGNRLRTVSRIFLASCTLFATAAISLGERPEISSSRARRTAAMMEAAMTSVGA